MTGRSARCKLIGGCRKTHPAQLFRIRDSVLTLIDKGLGMSNAESYRELLLFKRDLFTIELFYGIPGAVSDRKNDSLRRNPFFCPFICLRRASLLRICRAQSKACQPAGRNRIRFCLQSLESNPQLSFATRMEDWTSLGLHKRHPEFPVVIRESCYTSRSEERRVGKECRSRWSPYH